MSRLPVLIPMAALLLSCGAGAARAQTLGGIGKYEPRRYVEFDIKGSAKDLIKARLEEKQLKELIQKIAEDPSKFPDPATVKDQFKLDDPDKRKALEEMLARDRALQDAVRKIAGQPKAEKEPAKTELQEKLQEVLKEAEKKSMPDDPQQPPEGKPGTEPDADDDSLGKVAERAMKKAEGTRWGDFLRDSPAWNRAFRDLRESMHDPNASRMRPDRFKGKFGLDAGLLQLGEGALERIKEMPRPRLDGVKGALPGLTNVPTPNLSVPGLPDFGSPEMPTLSNGVIWVLLLLLFLLTAWQAWRWSKRSQTKAQEAARAALGPWPVSPEKVASASDLIRVFDYLALWSLGLAVRSWNHHAVARRWGEQAPHLIESAQELAQLYELARYVQGGDELTDVQCSLARHSLVQLREAF